jgi:FtsP/CotA-like multicopper oxidase with cupredoxin domain
MHLLKYLPNKLALTAFRNRQELIKAGLTRRRDLLKMGLLTSAGYLVAKKGLSSFSLTSRAYAADSPFTREFIEAMPIPPVQQTVGLTPAPQECPNTAAGERRVACHQAFATFPPQKFYAVTQKAGQVRVSPDLPLQTLWGFAIGTPTMNNPITTPGPTYIARYGEPILVRNFNQLPTDNGGFGLNSVSTHLHNGHTPSESDGNPCDFFESGFFYDQHYPNVLAGFASTHPPNGDINESMSSLWYHDHRVDFTSQNVYKGLAGFYNLFNEFDTGDETTGFRLPSGEFDVPVQLTDKVFDPSTGLLAFDLFNLDGILGDKFLANGKIQPFFEVKPRRYRFRVLDAGPSRFYRIFLTDRGTNTEIPFWQISNDGNLLPRPLQVRSISLGVAERMDIIIDFRPFAGRTLYFENRLRHGNRGGGRGPDGDTIADATVAAGQGNFIIQFRVGTQAVADNSADPATQTFYALPDKTEAPRITRTFDFNESRGQWVINDKFMDCGVIRFKVQRNSVEKWILKNGGRDWWHPIHIHFEEFQILQRIKDRNGFGGDPAVPAVETSRKDVVRLAQGERVELFFRFRDFLGKYPIHCHNTVHEDHAMMLNWEIATVGDNITVP